MSNKPEWVNLNISEASEMLGVERRHLGNTIAPIMMATDDAWQEAPGYPWAFRRDGVRQWAHFLEARSELIEHGSWSQKRAYSKDDFEDWYNGMFDDFLGVDNEDI